MSTKATAEQMLPPWKRSGTWGVVVVEDVRTIKQAPIAVADRLGVCFSR